MSRPIVHPSPMPGLGLSMGLTLTMLSLVVLLPIGALLMKGISFGPLNVWETVNRDRVWAALSLSFRLSLFAALFNLVFGMILAWVLVRYSFPGRRLLDAAVDLPFALPTAVAGIALTALYAPNGAFGSLAKEIGWKIAYTPWGIFIALVFVLGLFMAIGKAAVFKHIPVYYPQNVGAVGGMVGMVGGLGGFILPILFGAIVDLTGIRSSSFMLLYGTVCVSLIWMHFSFKPERTQPAAIAPKAPAAPVRRAA